MRREKDMDGIGKRSFNPRICKRCDEIMVSREKGFFCFNPRICKRCDLQEVINYYLVSVSIHASVKDATDLQT